MTVFARKFLVENNIGDPTPYVITAVGLGLLSCCLFPQYTLIFILFFLITLIYLLRKQRAETPEYGVFTLVPKTLNVEFKGAHSFSGTIKHATLLLDREMRLTLKLGKTVRFLRVNREAMNESDWRFLCRTFIQKDTTQILE